MTEFVFKPRGARVYSGRYRIAGESKITTVRLGVSDKQVARAKLRTLVEQREREAAGLLPSAAERQSASTSLREHVEAFLQFKSRVRNARYLYELKNRVTIVAAECAWTLLRDVTPERFERWRQNRKGSAKTLNEYLTSFRTLLNWMASTGRAADNPLRYVEPYRSDGAKRTRRALSHEEVRRLLGVAGEHRIIYHAALQTGLRRGELAKLRVSDVDLGDTPKMFLRGSITKNKKSEPIIVREDLARELASHISTRGLSTDDFLFGESMPTMKTHRRLLAAAEIPFVDCDGLRVDFHALRHTYCTNVQRVGANQRELMALMRHSERRLSDHVYTDVNLLPLAAVVQALPDFSPIQIATHDSGASSHKMSLTVADVSSAERAVSVVSRGKTHDKAQAVANSRESENGARYRVRTCDPYRVKVMLYH